ncbi:uncharacterized protein LOC112495288 isoform X2 [Cephus cinctus]|uniref:Uncharacterized protein LOC112495288 isoform X2 n=1 Tax=Cephus cinctus TaxID=211228 RepID=A0AAJ7RU01_CEPCN|nr:uncharacterized protein LOC112495288 isoform X2 [Cephus cinctus]
MYNIDMIKMMSDKENLAHWPFIRAVLVKRNTNKLSHRRTFSKRTPIIILTMVQSLYRTENTIGCQGSFIQTVIYYTVGEKGEHAPVCDP